MLFVALLNEATCIYTINRGRGHTITLFFNNGTFSLFKKMVLCLSCPCSLFCGMLCQMSLSHPIYGLFFATNLH